MRGEQTEFESRGAKVALVTMGNPEQTSRFCREQSVPFFCLSDPDKESYAAFGLRRGGAREILSPRNVIRGAQTILKGNVGGRPLGDPLQMPGAFVLDENGVVRYAHRHREVSDNPPNSELFQALDSSR